MSDDGMKTVRKRGKRTADADGKAASSKPTIVSYPPRPRAEPHVRYNRRRRSTRIFAGMKLRRSPPIPPRWRQVGAILLRGVLTRSAGIPRPAHCGAGAVAGVVGRTRGGVPAHGG